MVDTASDVKSRALVVGGSGFIGHHLCQWLNDGRFEVVNLDRQEPRKSVPGVAFVAADAANAASLQSVFAEFSPEIVFHLAANSDIASGANSAVPDFRDTLNTTVALRQIIERFPVKQAIFASSSAIFGVSESRLAESNEQYKTPVSWYGHAKLAGEYVLESLLRSHPSMKLLIFRFPNVVGPMATHGVIYDFIHRLSRDPSNLRILGDGHQTKPYIHVSELIRALTYLPSQVSSGYCEFNVGPDDAIEVRQIADAVCRILNLKPKLHFGNTPEGWLGDVPRYLFDTRKSKDLGFRTELSSLAAVELAISQIVDELNLGR